MQKLIYGKEKQVQFNNEQERDEAVDFLKNRKKRVVLTLTN